MKELKTLRFEEGRKVEVYRNLHFDGVIWSVRCCKTKIVLGHTSTIVLRDAELVVQPAGNKKVRKQKRKNVHAFVRGYMFDGRLIRTHKFRPATYDPYKHTTFVIKYTSRKVFNAGFALLDDKGLFVCLTTNTFKGHNF